MIFTDIVFVFGQNFVVCYTLIFNLNLKLKDLENKILHNHEQTRVLTIHIKSCI